MFAFAILILIPAVAFAQPGNPELENKLFGDLDENGDGDISKQEIEDLFLGFDTNKDSIVDKVEFKAGTDNIDAAFDGHEDALFGLLDRNSDGEVAKDDVDVVFNIADTNGNGDISRAEYEVLFKTVIALIEG